MPPHQYFYQEPSLKGLPTKFKEVSSPHEIRLSPAGPLGITIISTITIIVAIIIIVINILIFVITIFHHHY